MMNTETNTKPPITAADIKATGVNCWVQEFFAKPIQKLQEAGYTLDEALKGVQDFCYTGYGSMGPYVRLRPQFDPEAHVCELCNDPEIVKQPQADGSWLCPQCKGNPKFVKPIPVFECDCGCGCTKHTTNSGVCDYCAAGDHADYYEDEYDDN